jgi:predicted nucleotidyltransferase
MQRAPQELLKPPSTDDAVLQEIVQRLVEVYRPLRIYLFGSVARGEAGPDSDYDILVVVPDEAPAELRDCGPAYRALQGLRVAKDVFVWRQTEFDRRLHLKASLPSTVLREGRLLYAA